MTNTKERLAEIKARCDAATPGPWSLGGPANANLVGPNYFLPVIESDSGIYWGRDRQRAEERDLPTEDKDGNHIPGADMLFVMRARQDVPDLVAEVERLRTLVKEREWDSTSEDSEQASDTCSDCGGTRWHGHTLACETFTPGGEVK